MISNFDKNAKCDLCLWTGTVGELGRHVARKHQAEIDSNILNCVSSEGISIGDIMILTGYDRDRVRRRLKYMNAHKQAFFAEEIDVAYPWPDDMKCSTCHEIKPAQEFTFRNKTANIRHGVCRACKKAQSQKRKAVNKPRSSKDIVKELHNSFLITDAIKAKQQELDDKIRKRAIKIFIANHQTEYDAFCYEITTEALGELI